MRMKLSLALLSVLGLAACSDSSPDLPSAPTRFRADPISTASSVTPYVIAGDATCAEINSSWKELKIDPPTPGSFQSSDALLQATLASADGIHFDWTALVPPAALLLPGVSSTNVYAYTPPTSSDNGLQSPTAAAPNHISFCYDEDIAILYGLQINPTAFAIFKRTWSWEINKGADQSSPTLPIGQQMLVNYSVEASATNVDSDQHVYGDIFVTFPMPEPDVGLSVTVSSDIDQVVLSCSVGSDCHYYLKVSSNNAGGVSAIVRATSGDDVVEFPVSASADFSIGERDEIDETIDVTDDIYGYLGTAFAQVGQNSTTFNYSSNIGPYATCGNYTVTNTASFVSQDAGKTGSASWTININVPCATECALSSGYWKTHSRFGPAPYDDTWALLGEDTRFFLSGKSYYQVLWTPPAGGNAYYILAHSYIAAKLNILNGADPAPVQAAMASATALFNAYTPGANLSRSVRAQFIRLAAALESNNKGGGSPGHCSK